MSPRTFRIGLLGHGTVGGAFAQLLPAHAERIEFLTGLRPTTGDENLGHQAKLGKQWFAATSGEKSEAAPAGP